MDIENVTIKNHFEGDELYDYIKKYNVVNNDDLDFLDLGLADNANNNNYTAGVLYEDVCGDDSKLTCLGSKVGYLNELCRDSRFHYYNNDFSWWDMCYYSTTITACKITIPNGEIIYVLYESTENVDESYCYGDYLNTSVLYSNEEELMKAYHKYADSLLDIDSFDKELEIVKQKFKSKFPTFDFNIKPTTLSSYFEDIVEPFYAEKRLSISLQLNNGKSTHMITLYDNVRLSDVNDELMNKIYNSMMFLLDPHNDVLIHSIKLTNYSHYEMFHDSRYDIDYFEDKSLLYNAHYKKGNYDYEKTIEIADDKNILDYLLNDDYKALSDAFDMKYSQLSDLEKKIIDFSNSKELSCISSELMDCLKQNFPCYRQIRLLEHVKVSKTPADVVYRILNDSSITNTQLYAKVSKTNPKRHWSRILDMFEKCGNCFTTLSDVGGVKVGNDDSYFIISNGKGDGNTIVAIFDNAEEEFNEDMLNNRSAIPISGHHCIYEYDCGDSIKVKLDGEYFAYGSDGFVAFVKQR